VLLVDRFRLPQGMEILLLALKGIPAGLPTPTGSLLLESKGNGKERRSQV
jgi:hypothetical protein